MRKMVDMWYNTINIKFMAVCYSGSTFVQFFCESFVIFYYGILFEYILCNDTGEIMLILRYIKRCIIAILVLFLVMYIYDSYHSYQGTNRISKAHTSVEQTIEQTEDTLSRWERMYRVFAFKEHVQESLYRRVASENWVKSETIPDNAKRALVAIEDKRYYRHGAIDIFGVIRALYVNTVAGETMEGGSTITQQLVKNLFLSSKRIMSRKAEEAILAVEMEHYYNKDEIITMYLNTVYYGHNYYGIKAASEGYFGTRPSRLSLGQCALLAALPNAPSYLDPYVNYDAAKARQKLVLQAMVAQDMITQAEADYAYEQDLGLRDEE